MHHNNPCHDNLQEEHALLHKQELHLDLMCRELPACRGAIVLKAEIPLRDRAALSPKIQIQAEDSSGF